MDERAIVELICSGDSFDDVITAVKRNHPRKRQPAILDIVRSATERYIRKAEIPILLQAGVVMDRLMRLYEDALADGEYAAARSCLKDYWQLVKDTDQFTAKRRIADGQAQDATGEG